MRSDILRATEKVALLSILYKTKVIPNKVCIIRLYTIKYCIFRVNRLIFSRNFTSMALTISAYYLN